MAVLSNNLQSFSQNEAIYDFKAAKHQKASKESTDLTVSLEALSKTPLGKALEKDPVWQAATGQAPTKVILKDDFENFFLLMFKFMKADRSMNNQLQLSSVASMIVQNHMLDTLSSQAVDNMHDMDKKIQSAIDDKPSVWLSIVLPVGLMVLGILLGCLTGGAGEAALDASAQAASKAGTQVAEKTAVEATEVAEKAAQEAANTAVNGASKAGQAVGGASEKASSEVVTQATEETSKETSKEISQGAVKESVTKASTEGTKDAVKKTLTERIKEVLKSPKTYMMMGSALGVGSMPIIQGIGSATGCHQLKDFSGEETQAASSHGSAVMNVISASTEAAQGRVKQETQTQQNAASNEQADLSTLQQLIQSQQQAFGLGKL